MKPRMFYFNYHLVDSLIKEVYVQSFTVNIHFNIRQVADLIHLDMNIVAI
jgi:hypothetical protein